MEDPFLESKDGPDRYGTGTGEGTGECVNSRPRQRGASPAEMVSHDPGILNQTQWGK